MPAALIVKCRFRQPFLFRSVYGRAPQSARCFRVIRIPTGKCREAVLCSGKVVWQTQCRRPAIGSDGSSASFDVGSLRSSSAHGDADPPAQTQGALDRPRDAS
jgi:hypothetical protein